MASKEKIEFEKSSGNIFADLGFENAEELYARGLIGCHVVKLLKDNGMKQRELATLLNVKQTEISHLMNGHFSRFSIDRLIDFLVRLNYKITINISPRREGEPHHNVAFGA